MEVTCVPSIANGRNARLGGGFSLHRLGWENQMERGTKSRVCRWSGVPCHFPTCSFVDSHGNIRVCRHHLRPAGMNRARVLKKDFMRGRGFS